MNSTVAAVICMLIAVLSAGSARKASSKEPISDKNLRFIKIACIIIMILALAAAAITFINTGSPPDVPVPAP